MARKADDLARILKVLSVGTRVRIMQILKGRSLCVGAMASQLDVTQGAVSQHLRLMRDAGLVIDEKRGCYVHYRLNEETLARWRGQVDNLLAPSPSVKRSGVCRPGGSASAFNGDARRCVDWLSILTSPENGKYLAE